MVVQQSAPRRRLSGAERREQILDVADSIFAERGFRRASMDEVAASSGVTKPLVYHHFGSKEGLYEACVERARAGLFEKLETVTLDTAPQARVRAFIELYFAFLEEHRCAWWMLYGDSSIDATNVMRERNTEAIAGLLRGGLGGDEPRLAILASALVGAGEQVARWWLQHPQVSRARVLDEYLSILEPAIASACGRR